MRHCGHVASMCLPCLCHAMSVPGTVPDLPSPMMCHGHVLAMSLPCLGRVVRHVALARVSSLACLWHGFPCLPCPFHAEAMFCHGSAVWCRVLGLSCAIVFGVSLPCRCLVCSVIDLCVPCPCHVFAMFVSWFCLVFAMSLPCACHVFVMFAMSLTCLWHGLLVSVACVAMDVPCLLAMLRARAAVVGARALRWRESEDSATLKIGPCE